MERKNNNDQARDRPLMGASDRSLGPILGIEEGMKVVDSTGEELGSVEVIRMGDPEAVTVQGQRDERGNLLSDLANAFRGETEPDVPEPLRSQMLRSGFIKVDGKGWIDTDRYVSAEFIGGVADDTVTLTLEKDQILQSDAGRG